ncbi:MAG: helix-turn-helix domain-containing protein [Rhizobiaceae bacterium]
MIEDVVDRDLGHTPRMPKISVALLMFVFLSLLAVNLWRKRRETTVATPFLVIATLAAMQALLVSLRWDFGLMQFRVPQILLAAVLPGAVWLAFQVSIAGVSSLRPSDSLNAVPVVLVAISLAVLPDMLDILLVLTFLFYGLRFLRLAFSGETSFGSLPFEGVINMRRAVWLLTFALLGSAVVDILVFMDFLSGSGTHAVQLIGAGHLIWLLVMGASIALGSNALPAELGSNADFEEASAPEAEDLKVAESIGELLSQTGLAKDSSLTLSRLARRAGLPMRTVSAAINRVHGRNVSQYINDIRIMEACRLLKDSDLSVTQVIYESGFQTKSNFNREFTRVTGKTPRDWRRHSSQVPQSLSTSPSSAAD